MEQFQTTGPVPPCSIEFGPENQILTPGHFALEILEPLTDSTTVRLSPTARGERQAELLWLDKVAPLIETPQFLRELKFESQIVDFRKCSLWRFGTDNHQVHAVSCYE